MSACVICSSKIAARPACARIASSSSASADVAATARRFADRAFCRFRASRGAELRRRSAAIGVGLFGSAGLAVSARPTFEALELVSEARRFFELEVLGGREHFLAERFDALEHVFVGGAIA